MNINLRSYLVSLKQYWQNREVCNEIRKYKGIHKGKRCFIIGTGPSLTVEDLDKLKDEYTFGSNRIYEIYPRTSWRPTYYMNQDFQLIEKFQNEISGLEVKRKFMPIEARRFFNGKEDTSYFVLRQKNFYPKKADFSTRLDRYVGQGYTVTYGAIQMAYYMGFSEVFLLGIDHNYSISLDERGVPVLNNGTKDYFDGSKASNKGLNLPRVVESTMAYITAQRFCDKHKEFKVFNATRGGKLETFPRVNLDDILKS